MPPSELVIEDLVVTRGTVWVADIDGGPQQLRAFDLQGRQLPSPEIPPVSSVSSYSTRWPSSGTTRSPGRCESFTEPPSWWVAADGEAPRRTALDTTSPVDLSGFEVTREFAQLPGRHPCPAQHHRRARAPRGTGRRRPC